MSNITKTSRSINTCAFGKCNADIKTKVPDEIKEQVEVLARHTTVSEYTRDMVMLHCYGKLSVMSGRIIQPEEVEECKVTDLISAFAALNNQSFEDYTRDLYLAHVYGHVAIIRNTEKNGMPALGTKKDH